MDIRHAVGVKAGAPAGKLTDVLTYRGSSRFNERGARRLNSASGPSGTTSKCLRCPLTSISSGPAPSPGGHTHIARFAGYSQSSEAPPRSGPAPSIATVWVLFLSLATPSLPHERSKGTSDGRRNHQGSGRTESGNPLRVFESNLVRHEQSQFWRAIAA